MLLFDLKGWGHSFRVLFMWENPKQTCDLESVDSMDSSASKKKGFFSMTMQTNELRVACNFKRQQKNYRLIGLFWRNSSMKMPPE